MGEGITVMQLLVHIFHLKQLQMQEDFMFGLTQDKEGRR